MNGMNGVAALIVGSVDELPDTDLPFIERKHCYAVTDRRVRDGLEGLRVYQIFYTGKALRGGDVDTWEAIWSQHGWRGVEVLHIHHYGESHE